MKRAIGKDSDESGGKRKRESKEGGAWREVRGGGQHIRVVTGKSARNLYLPRPRPPPSLSLLG